jgi:23S rRNA (guanine745-N1)-methyltransferase
VLNERQYRCENNHCYDLAREGYVNLLLANQKKSKDAGDSKEMIQARRRFLSQGYYDLLPTALVELVSAHLPAAQQACLLDVGCGDGYYTGYIQQRVADRCQFWGLDISKPGIIAAAKQFKEINFSVSSSYRLPLQDESVDAIIKIFAPGDEQEFHRTLKEQGIYISVVQGQRHLYALKEIIYPEPQEHSGDEELPAGFELVEKITRKGDIKIANNGDIKNLLMMTPYYWHLPRDVQEKMTTLKSLSTEIEFSIRVYRKQ